VTIYPFPHQDFITHLEPSDAILLNELERSTKSNCRDEKLYPSNIPIQLHPNR
jgi:hypothetical protein